MSDESIQRKCVVCGAPARYGLVCGAACDVVMGDHEDTTPLVVALLTLAALAAMALWEMFA